MNRYVAFLDILGFSELVNTEPLGTVMRRIEVALDSLSRARDAGPMVGIQDVAVRPVRAFSFSDTFVLLSDNDSQEAFLSFFVAATLLTRNLFAQALPVRGAITFGEADFVPHTPHAIGKAIVAAHVLEKRQEWLGVVIDESTFPPSVRPVLDHRDFAAVITRWDVPAKKNEILSRALVVNWRYNLELPQGAASLFRSSRDPTAPQKIQNTLDFVRHVEACNFHQGPGNAHNAMGEAILAPWLTPIPTEAARTMLGDGQ